MNLFKPQITFEILYMHGSLLYMASRFKNHLTCESIDNGSKMHL